MMLMLLMVSQPLRITWRQRSGGGERRGGRKKRLQATVESPGEFPR